MMIGMVILVASPGRGQTCNGDILCYSSTTYPIYAFAFECSDQPSALDEDECVESVPWAKGRWNDHGCHVPRAYLCRLSNF
jgi:hypothetical protein